MLLAPVELGYAVEMCGCEFCGLCWYCAYSIMLAGVVSESS